MKVSDLTGAQLDYWVAKAENQVGLMRQNPQRFVVIEEDGSVRKYAPSTEWSQGGPIIEAGCFVISDQAYDVGPATGSGWIAAVVPYGLENQAAWRAAKKYFAKSLLVAAMRAHVASKFGDEVPEC